MVFLFLLVSWILVNAQEVDLTHHVLKPPFAGPRLPFWNIGSGAYMDKERQFIRLTQAKPRRHTGFLWNTMKSAMSDWEVTIEFRISSHREEENRPSEGFAFWYTERPGIMGPVFGSMDFWNGLAIFFDSKRQDNSDGDPIISAMFNDGTQRYIPADDGASQALATCSLNYRNLPWPAMAKISYSRNTLTLQIAVERENDQPRFEPCFQVSDLVLGVDKFWGLTATNGPWGTDNQDIISFDVKDLTSRQTNLNDVRDRYRERIQQQHLQPNHQEMDSHDFQHEVLTLLNQVQEAANLLELSQIAIERAVHSMFRQKDDAAPEASWQGIVRLVDFQGKQLLDTTKASEELRTRTEAFIRSRGDQRPEDLTRTLNELKPMVANQFRRIQDTMRIMATSLQNLDARAHALQEFQQNSRSAPTFLYGIIFITLCGALTNTFFIFQSYKGAGFKRS